MQENLLEIGYQDVPKVLLLGNGINRAYGFSSWEELIKSVQTKELTKVEQDSINNVPYPLQPVILTEDHIGTRMKELSEELSSSHALSDEEIVLRNFAELPFDTILTTNYTYELENALYNEFKCLPRQRCKSREVAFDNKGKYETRQLHTYFSIKNYPPIWHIHGEASRHETMVLGHYYYGKLLAKMQQYVPSLLARSSVRTSKKESLKIHSWIDYFMLGDVYIVGLGLSLSELDLWWLINCKKRHFPGRKIILFKPDIKPEEKLLAEVYGVTVFSDGNNNDYKSYYDFVFEKLKKDLK